jgi:Skp family chaperone for outer membrane proteins
LCALAVTGCGKTDATGGGKAGAVGIVDLDLVSKEVGWSGEIDDDRKAAEQDVNSQFQVYVTGVQNAWTARRQAIGDAAHLTADQLKIINAPQINGDDFQKLPLSKDQKDDFLHSANEASQTLNQAKQVAQQKLQEREARVIDSYREAMKPSVRRVAASANVSIVLPPQSVFYYDPMVDLSNQVVDDLRKAMPQHTMPPMVKLNFPDFKFTTGVPAAVSSPAAPTHTTPPSSDSSH